MSGLMTGRREGLEPRGYVSAIAPSLMKVVENALSWAWRELLSDVANGHFSICKSDEDQITRRLYSILCRMHAKDPDRISGFSLFETPVREGNMSNYDGKHPDRQPDLTFRPLRGHIQTSDSSLAGIFVECKPIDSGHPIQSVYCKEGLIRFIRGDYAWAVDHALMVGYVRNRCHLPSGLTPCIDDDQAGKKYRFEGNLTALTPTSSGDAVYQSTHRRTFSLSSQPADSIDLHHLWLHLIEPCEKSRCRTR